MKLSKRILSSVCSLAMLMTCFAATPVANAAAMTPDECYAEGYDVSVQIGAEGAVLLKNDNSVLPLAENTKVTVLGSMSYNYVLGGTGSAVGADDENTVMMNDALTEAGLDVNEAAWSWLEEQCGGARAVDANDPAGVGWSSYTAIHEFPVSVYQDASSTILQDGYTDYAIVTISRSGMEGASPSMDMDGDGSTLTGTTYLMLSDNEKDLLTYCKANFSHTILLINSPAAMELGFLDADEYGVEAALWIGHPGEAGITGVCTILSGRSNPSGRLVDTYSYDHSTNPTYYNTDDNRYVNADNQTFYQYEEGIYVGYRFYETADAMGYFDSDAFTTHTFKNGTASGYEQVVQYPFGYGLSYTTFTEEITASDVTLAAHGTNSITVKVTNTGDVAGKNVVQLYMEAPYQTNTEDFGIKGVGLEKAKVVLIGYAKTATLEPGASEEVTISFTTDNLASYDNFGQGCYVLEAGSYSFNVQKDAHQWGEEGSENAASAMLKVDLPTSYIYKDEGTASASEFVGKRDSDAVVAENAMDDVTAGDGNMLDGYLSRNDFAYGMSEIMKHQSDEEPNESLAEGLATALAVDGNDTYDYTFSTYIGGVKTEVTETLYAAGNNVAPWAAILPDGTDTSTLEDPLWEQTYYVVEGETTAEGYPVVVEEEPASGSYHKLTVADLIGVDIDTDEGLRLFDLLANETTMDEAIELQGDMGWKMEAIESVGMPHLTEVEGSGEVGNSAFAGSTWWPCAVLVASTWNNDLAYAEGSGYGHQGVLYNIDGVHYPAMNIHRSPYGGRNFEYYSEDGLLSGYIGGNVAAGTMAVGINVFVKHCALNDGDTNRSGNCTWANEQAVRELYMKDYEICVKEFDVNGIMGSLNRIGTSYFHYGMYKTMIRNEWNYRGLLMTDGDGSSGASYNNPVFLTAVDCTMLSMFCYINARATLAAYGDSTDYVYCRVCLHNIIRSGLNMYCSTVGNK